MNSPLASLDQQELQKLAAAATARGDSAATLVYLKESVSRSNATAGAHYLLGIEYAELRMYDRAIDAIEAALALDPSLVLARFQLGLLHMTSGDGPRAIEVLAALDDLSEPNYLRNFGAGLCHMARDEFGAALDALRAGLVLNQDNAPLNTDMQRVIDDIVALQAANAEKEDATQDANLMFLSAYTGNTSH